MKKFYLVSSIILFILILVASIAQIGSSCSWYLFKSDAAPFIVLLQMAGLGAVLGGLLVLYWKMPKESELSEDDVPGAN